MPRRTVKHDTIQLERRFKASPKRVFAAWSDIDARREWISPAAGWVHADDGGDFRVGGDEIMHFGPKDDPQRFQTEVHYLHIDAERRIVMAGPMSDRNVPVSFWLTTVEFLPDGDDTHVVFTEQAAFFDGHDASKENKAGWKRNFDQLDDYLANED